MIYRRIPVAPRKNFRLARAKGVHFERYENGQATYRLTSGTYRFEVPQ
jgi:hypothetical protein